MKNYMFSRNIFIIMVLFTCLTIVGCSNNSSGNDTENLTATTSNKIILKYSCEDVSEDARCSIRNQNYTESFFNGTDNYIKLDKLEEDFSETFSISAWVNFTEPRSYERIIEFGNGEYNNNIVFSRYSGTDNLSLIIHDDQGNRCFSIAYDAISNHEMHLYTVTLEGYDAKIYKDAKLIKEDTLNCKPVNIVRTKNYIAKSNWDVDPLFKGYISEVQVYNYALSNDEINVIYGEGNPLSDDLYGQWLYIDDGSKEQITSKSSLAFSKIDDNLLEVTSLEDEKRYILRDSIPKSRVIGRVVSSEGNAIENVQVSFTNILDERIQANIISNTNGLFECNTLPSGNYEVNASLDDKVFEKTILINDAVEDLGTLVLRNKTLSNLKAELIFDKNYVYADGKSYSAIFRVHNIGDDIAVGLTVELNISNPSLESLQAESILGSISAGEYKDIPIVLTFKEIQEANKDITLNTSIRDLNGEEWSDTLKFNIYKDSITFYFDANERSIKGYIVIPNQKVVPILNLWSSSITLPYRNEEEYQVILVNPDLRNEMLYTMSINQIQGMETNFQDVNIYEPNNSYASAKIIEIGDSITGYLHIGDIDYYKLILASDSFITFDMSNTSMANKYISKSITIDNELLNNGHTINIDQGTLFVNGENIGTHGDISLNDSIEVVLDANEDFTQIFRSKLHIGSLEEEFIITPLQMLLHSYSIAGYDYSQVMINEGERYYGRGEYKCGENMVELNLLITSTRDPKVLKGEFIFNYNDGAAVGKYNLDGYYDENSSELVFEAGEWIYNPNHYTAVGMRGKIIDNVYQGEIEYSSCGAFYVDFR